MDQGPTSINKISSALARNVVGLFLYFEKANSHGFFFERWFGFSGGRGDGSLEFIFLVVLFAITVVIAGVFLNKAKNKVDKQ
jgi:hypothetical protein